MIRERKTTNILLLIIVIPLVFYLLKTLSFIFVPLVSSMFIALLFLPLMRWLKKRKVNKGLSIALVIVIIAVILKISGELIQLSSKELLSTDNAFFEKARIKLADLVVSLEQFFGVEFIQGENELSSLVNRDTVSKGFAPTLGFVTNTISRTLTMVFFAVLLLAGSVDFQKFLNTTILKQQFASVKTFMKIESDLLKFIKVKFLVSLLTGIFTGLSCLAFGVSFPIFWGLFAFLINFVQMIGSIVTVLLLAVFAFVEIDQTSILLFFILTTTGVQAIFGGVLEPIFMGKSFSLNIITVLVMLMLWGYIWGIPGLIMSIPITVFLKILLEKFPNTRIISNLMSGNQNDS